MVDNMEEPLNKIPIGGNNKDKTDDIYRLFGGSKTATISTTNEKGETTRFYSTRIPPLEIKTGANKSRRIDVVVSSVEEEQVVLLHRLYGLTKGN